MRNCECICTPPMFRSRVSGVGIDISRYTNTDIQLSPFEMDQIRAQKKYDADMALWNQTYGDAYSKVIDTCPRCITAPCPCTAADEFLRLHPRPVLEKVNAPAPSPTPSTKPTGSALPLLLGAAYLLFS